MVIIWSESRFAAGCFLSYKLAHLPEASLPHSGFCITQFAESVSSVGEPLAFIHIAARPCEDSEAAHIAGLPLPVITLVLEVTGVLVNWDHPSKQTLTVVLSFLPLSSVASLSLIKDEVPKRFSLPFLEVPEINLFDLLFLVRATLRKHRHEATATWQTCVLLPVVNWAIRKLLNQTGVFLAVLLNARDNVLVWLLGNVRKIKLVRVRHRLNILHRVFHFLVFACAWFRAALNLGDVVQLCSYGCLFGVWTLSLVGNVRFGNGRLNVDFWFDNIALIREIFQQLIGNSFASLFQARIGRSFFVLILEEVGHGLVSDSLWGVLGVLVWARPWFRLAIVIKIVIVILGKVQLQIVFFHCF